MDPKLLAYLHKLIKIRKQIPELNQEHFFSRDKVQWKNDANHDLDWSSNDFFLVQHFHSGFIVIYNLTNEDKPVSLGNHRFIELLC
ncbi:MAG: hypothetical protein EBS19_05120, partial [Spirochaetia bacterium]|nr:hypothetical protein [Spirochaetia bacterium]